MSPGVRRRIRQARADVATMRRLFPHAEALARAQGRSAPGVEHLVVAALDLPDGTARGALGDVGIAEAGFRAALTEAQAPPAVPADGASSGVYRSEPSMQLAFHRAVGNAKAARSAVRSGDLLLAALEPDEGTVARALLALGVDRAVLAAAVHRRLGT